MRQSFEILNWDAKNHEYELDNSAECGARNALPHHVYRPHIHAADTKPYRPFTRNSLIFSEELGSSIH